MRKRRGPLPSRHHHVLGGLSEQCLPARLFDGPCCACVHVCVCVRLCACVCVRVRALCVCVCVCVCAHGSIARSLTRSPTCQRARYVEFGAGSGGVSKAIRRSAPNARIILVERMHFRINTDREFLAGHGADKHRLAKKSLEAALQASEEFFRACADIRHVNVKRLPCVGGRPVVATAKHLCGVATDLTINALATQLSPASGELAGTAIVTCCHNLCRWADYPAAAKAWLAEAAGVDAARFELMRQCCAWAVSHGDGGRDAEQSKRQSKRRAQRDADLELLRAAAAWEDERGASPGPAARALQAAQAAVASAMSAKQWRAQLGTAERKRIGRCCKHLLDRGTQPPAPSTLCPPPPPLPRARTRTHASTHRHTDRDAHRHTHTRARTDTHTHTRARTRTHTPDRSHPHLSCAACSFRMCCARAACAGFASGCPLPFASPHPHTPRTQHICAWLPLSSLSCRPHRCAARRRPAVRDGALHRPARHARKHAATGVGARARPWWRLGGPL